MAVKIPTVQEIAKKTSGVKYPSNFIGPIPKVETIKLDPATVQQFLKPKLEVISVKPEPKKVVEEPTVKPKGASAEIFEEVDKLLGTRLAPIIKAAKEGTVQDVGKELKTNVRLASERIGKQLETPEGIAQTAINFLTFGKGKISPKKVPPTIPELKPEITNTIADEAIKFAQANPESSLVGKVFRDPMTKEQLGGPRLFKRIGEGIRNGEVGIEALPEIVKKYGVTAEETAKLFEDAATYSGRTLQALSRVEKELRTLLPDIQIAKREATIWEFIKSKYLAVDNFRRGLLVTQLATAARNAISQAGRYSIGAVTDGMNGVISKIGGKGDGLVPFFEDITAIFRKMKPGNTAKLLKVMQDYPLENARLFNTPVGDVALSGKITNTLNTLNRGQEYFFRNLVMDAKLHAASKLKGIPIEKLPIEDVARAVDEALEWTFAKSPGRGTFGGDYIRMYNAMPLMTLVNPFPRFMANAIKFLYEYSPAGIMSLIRPSARAAIAAGDYTAISKAIIGTSMLGAAITVRSNPNIAGEKWYEIKWGDKTIDTRPFAPFSTYLFLAEIMANGDDKITGPDWAQVAAGVNRVSGTGLVIIDLLGDNVDWAGFKNKTNNFLSTYLSGFTVPFVTLKDAIGQFRLEERTVKETRDIPIVGGAIGNIPGLNELLPTKYSLFEDAPLMRESPLLRQLSGITVTRKPFIQKELDRMGKEVGDLIPKTGNLEANRILTKQTGILLDGFNDALKNGKGYNKMSDDAKLELIKSLVSEAKKEAKGQVAADLATIVYNELKNAKKEDRATILKELYNKGLLTENIQEYLAPMLEAQPLP